MTSQVVLPELGENIETADVSAVLVSVGDRIRRDQPVIEVETEKASLEVPASADGKVAELFVHAGDTVKVGQVILVLELSSGVDVVGDENEAATEPEPGPPAAAEPAVPPAEAERPVRNETTESEPAILAFRAASRAPAPRIGAVVPAAPSVRALARELGVDIGEVPGSGSSGRITRDDVKAWAKHLIRSSADGGRDATATANPPLPDFSRWGAVRREPMHRVRRLTAANMARAWRTVPHVTQFDRADVTVLESMRKDFNRRPEAAGAKLTVTAFVLKAVAAALERFPQFNASLDPAAGEVVYREYVHLGVAVDTDRGLLVPVVRDVASKPLSKVATELASLAARAREKKLAPDEMAGACFTVSNLGGLGTTHFAPIVNWPEVGILGVGRADTHAVHDDGRFVPRLILPLSISYDHRLVDGADAARFLRWIAEALEQPLLLLLAEANGRPR